MKARGGHTRVSWTPATVDRRDLLLDAPLAQPSLASESARPGSAQNIALGHAIHNGTRC
jgi:hypothetical protein